MSIARVAEAANVSYATAWRIINNRPCSSETAIKAVKRAVREVGYEPSQPANGGGAGGTNGGGTRRGRPVKMLDGIRTRNVALLHLRSSTALSTEVLSTVQRRLAERDLNLLFAQVETAASLPPAVRSANVDGILGYGKFPDEAVTQQLERIPAVWMMSRNDRELDRFGDRVMPDHAAIGDVAAEYLAGRRCQRIGVINPYPESEIYRVRCDAFLATARRAGMRATLLLGEAKDGQTSEVARLADRWIADCTSQAIETASVAIFVPADEIALPLHRHLIRMGVKLAEPGAARGTGLEIVSSDNDRELMAQMSPPPQTIDLNREAIADLAIERLFCRMRQGPSQPQVTLLVRPTLVRTPTPGHEIGQMK
jgi:DNA-binding LacI/PurR family transcriptional regulator